MAPIIWTWNGNKGVYTGELLNPPDTPHGRGTIDYVSGPLNKYRYEGGWYAGLKHGQGKLTGPDYEYEGSFVQDRIEGHGVKTYKDGHIYDGWFVAGKCDGNGTVTWPNRGWVYSGQFKKDNVSGKGTFRSESRDVTYWSDNWLDDKINGVGNARFPGGATYQGRFVNGQAEGTNGFYTYANRHDTYRGGFKGGKRDGNGVLRKEGYEYRGKFSKGDKTGRFTVKNLSTGKTTTKTY